MKAAAPVPKRRITVLDTDWSDPGPDGVWTAGEHMDITLVLSEPVRLSSTNRTPSDPSKGNQSYLRLAGHWCEHGSHPPWALYERGNGTTQLTFRCTIRSGERVRAGTRVLEDHPTSWNMVVHTNSNRTQVFGDAPVPVPPVKTCSDRGYPGQIWCGTLTVGSSMLVNQGFNANAGSLVRARTFSYGGSSYEPGKPGLFDELETFL